MYMSVVMSLLATEVAYTFDGVVCWMRVVCKLASKQYIILLLVLLDCWPVSPRGHSDALYISFIIAFIHTYIYVCACVC